MFTSSAIDPRRSPSDVLTDIENLFDAVKRKYRDGSAIQSHLEPFCEYLFGSKTVGLVLLRNIVLLIR